MQDAIINARCHYLNTNSLLFNVYIMLGILGVVGVVAGWRVVYLVIDQLNFLFSIYNQQIQEAN
jgi:hypothetical protein